MTRLSQRELLSIGAGLVLLLAAGLWLVRPFVASRDRLDSNIQRDEKRLQDLLSLEQTYRKVRAENDYLEEYLGKRQTDFTLFAFLEGLASRDGLKQHIEFMRPSVKPLSDTHQEDQVEMRLNGVSLSRLVPYLYHIETSPEQVRIKRLTIRPNRRDQSLLEVNLVVVTRGLREEPPGASGKATRLKSQPGVRK